MKNGAFDLFGFLALFVVAIAGSFFVVVSYSTSLAALENKDCIVAKPLAGTIWEGDDSDGDHYVYRFMKEGILDYSSPTGRYTNGKWTQSCGKVMFHMNNHFSDYEGDIRGPIMNGEAKNTKNHHWWWQAARK